MLEAYTCRQTNNLLYLLLRSKIPHLSKLMQNSNARRDARRDMLMIISVRKFIISDIIMC